MKNRYRFLAILSVLFFGFNVAFADRVSQEEAAAIAARFTNEQPQLSRMHKAPRQASNMRLAHKALQNNSEEAAFYVFNQEGSKGFVIVSADDRTAEDVLGYGVNGSFDAEHINPNLQFWLNRYAEEITALQTIDDSEFEQSSVRKAKQVTAIANLLVNDEGEEITWYQESPYNDLCPMDQRDNTRCLTGCVATAASQIMYKWRWPKKGTGSSSYTWYDCKDDNCNQYWTKTLSANYGETTYDWDNMLPGYDGVSSTSAQKTAVATLMYHAGVAAEMGYGGDATGGSGAWTDDMGYGLKTYFGYKFDKFITMYSESNYKSAKGTIADVTCEFNVTTSKITEYFNADLEAGRPIIMGGEGNAGGHEFVCCGRDANNKFYINWGWEGSNNGYFALTALKPGSYNFSSNLDALVGLRPDKKDLPMIDITWSVDGEETTVQSMQEEQLELPENPANCESGKVFVGWTAQSSVDGDKPADLFTTAAGKYVSEAVTYYAVFATAEANSVSRRAKAEETTLWAEDFSGYSANDVPSGSVADSHTGTTVYGGGSVTYSVDNGGGTTKVYNEALAQGTAPELLIAKSGGAFSIAGIPTGGASELTLTFNTNKTSGLSVTSATSGVTVGTLSIESNVATCTISCSGVESLDLTITFSPSSNSREDNFKLVGEAGGGVTFSDYSLSCGAAVECELTNIALNTENVQKAFTTNDEFTSAGLVVTAKYSNCNDKTKTSQCVVTAPDMSSAGTKDVIVSYTEGDVTKEASYKITISDPKKYTVTWIVEGVETEVEYVEGEPLEPTVTPDDCSEDRIFVGWTANSVVDGDRPSDLFESVSGNVTADATYYAVFATKEASYVSHRAKAEETTLWAEDFSSYSAGDVPQGEVADSQSGTTVYGGGTVTYSVDNGGGTTKVFNEALAQGTAPELLIAKSGGAFSIAGIPTGGASELTLTFNTNKTSGLSVTSATSGVTVGTLSIESNVATCTISCSGVESLDLTITFSSSSNSREDNFLLVAEVGGGVTFSDYSLSCGAAEECELTGITLNTDNVKKDFTTGEAFTAEGLVVTAHYSNCNDKTVRGSVAAPLTTTAGEKTVTVSYTEGDVTEEASYTITVTDPVKYTVTWSIEGVETAVEYIEGQPLMMPEVTPNDCSDSRIFVGWTASNAVSEKPADLFVEPEGNVEADITYYAVFATVEVSNVIHRAKAEETTLWAEDFSSYSAGDVPQGEVADSQSGTTVYGGGTVTYSVEDGGGTTKIFSEALAGGESPELLVAKNSGAFSIAGIPTGGAAELTLTYNTNKTTNMSVTSATSGVTVGTLSVTDKDATCTISCAGVESLDLTITNNNGSTNIRMDNFKLVGEASGSISYSAYSLACEEKPTDVEAVQTMSTVQKQLIGDQLFIIRDGSKFTVTGVRVQ